MNGKLTAYLRHVRIRLAWTLRDPESFLVLLFASLATLAFWPGSAGPVGTDPERLEAGMAWFFWLWLWPALPMLYAGGRAVGTRAENDLFRSPLPMLPVGTRTRMAGELTVALVWIVVVRAGAALLGTAAGWGDPVSAQAGDWLRGTILGCVAVSPFLVAWALPWSGVQTTFLATFLLTVFFAVLRQTGFLGDTWLLVWCCGAVCALVFAFAGRAPTWRGSRPLRGPIGPLWRRACSPGRQLERDTWLLPGARFGTAIAIAGGILLAALAIHATGHGPVGLLFGAVLLWICVFWWPVLHPFGSSLIGDGWAGRNDARPGAFVRAWSTLPARPEHVLRRVYLYGLAMASAMWAVPVLALIVRSWILFGSPSLRISASGGSIADLVLPLAALVPCLPALLVAGAVGHTLHTIFGAAGVIGIFHGHVLVLALLSNSFPRGSSMPVILDWVFVLLLALTAALPPLVHLRTRRAAPAAR